MTEKIHIIDLGFLEEKETIAAFLIEASEGPILIETGPETTWQRLVAGLDDLGYRPQDIQHVLLSHIHFDHAGAAWKLAEAGASIYVHPKGLPHLASPQRLWDSAAQIYGKDMERLWGEMRPIAQEQLKPVDHEEALYFGDISLKALHTPGHASHHIAWQCGDAIFTGDVAGVKIGQGPVVPPCPPPDIHIEDWKASIDLLRQQHPKRLYLTHFGIVDHPEAHLSNLQHLLETWALWMKEHFDNKSEVKEVEKKFMDYTRGQIMEQNVSPEDYQRYELANPSWMSVSGLLRYWKLKDQGRI